ncbi:flagellar biosynthesis anti-sigma factor FlgM [Methylocaldum sp.]|uniref:flagellar biosynthesis anti-sigma factor FlgM n=1 Tax=Methylocaldum sp. TaxID=1969727 RepID=UPI002D51C19E|nr:flagellar biosynthesis anti-sigma factor FlgM [Methylocaldum sp.]HYE33923.1 flagellar biosynthesis anti-sigma factor FlgM [Methylocaldum sp.]
MEIKLQNTISGLSTGATHKKTNKETPAGVGESDASSTSIGSVSPETSLRLSEVTERLLTESSVDDARVARIAGAVQSGNYEINPQRAAEKLIAMERMLPRFS